jgi:hypothetical protein
MAKRKRAKSGTKSKSAKRKSVKKKSAKTAKTRRAASKRTKAKVAKRKTVKRKVATRKTAARKTTKRTAPPRRTREDPCKPERDERNRLTQEERNILDQLSDFDIPPETRQQLQQLLAQTRAQRVIAQRELDECVAKHQPPTT